jgi:hypothetical protein
MALQTSGQITLSDIQDEFGGVNPIGLSEYYRGGAYTTDNNTSVPTSGTISLSDFYGAVKTVAMTYEIIGGGGEGGGGSYGGTGSAGGSSSISGAGITTVSASGGSGGIATGFYTGQDGASSFYGVGGSGGLNSDSGNQSPGFPAPSSSYGAGGGGGGSAPFAAYNGGGGGGASTRQTGTVAAIPGGSVTVVVGSGGSGIVGGGDGAGGYVKLTVGGVSTQYTTVGTHTYTVPS